MAEVLMCNCGRYEVDEYEVRLMSDGVHTVSGCEVDNQ